MKAKLNKFFKDLVHVLWVLFTWSVISTSLQYTLISDTTITYYGKYRFRWYSPTGWLFVIYMLITYLWEPGLQEFCEDMADVFTAQAISTNTFVLDKAYKYSWQKKLKAKLHVILKLAQY